MLTLLLALAATAAPSMAQPSRLTAGPSNQMLGVLGPGGRLFYVDDDQGPLSIKSLEPGSGAAGLLLDDAADASAPRPSRDGRRLLYISYQTNAAGQLCVRDFDSSGSPGDRRCLSGEGEAVYQADWLPDGQSIAALVRPALSADFMLMRYPLAGGEAQPLFADAANLGSPAVSPDGKLVAYVPLKRVSTLVSPTFAADAAPRLELRRLHQPSAPAVSLDFDLPGVSGFPAFSLDGKQLYFTQFLNDTNFDGTIDGKDNGVIFRAAFDGQGKAARAEQLTSAEWSCQYPAPAPYQLIVTCLFEGSLHVYSLPPEGAVPSSWTRERIDDQLTASRGRWEQLLLLARRHAAEPAQDHGRTLLRMIELHLSLGELESSEFYTRRLPSSELGPTLLELIAHRRAEAGLARGEPSERFIAQAEARLKRLPVSDAKPAVAALSQLVASEIHGVLGEHAQALRLVAGLALEQVTEPFVLRFAAERAAEVGRDLDSRDLLLGVYRRLSSHASLDERDRLTFADRHVRWLVRGRSSAEIGHLLNPPGIDPASELGFRLDLERRLVGLTPEAQEEVRAKIHELYKASRSFERRRALVETTVRRAARADNEYLLYQFADTWVSYIKPEQAERRPAEDLYRQVVLERAYIERATGKVGDARGHFFGVTLQTDALEAHVGFIEQRLSEGKSTTDVLKEYAQRRKSDDPVRQFAQAYLAARSLPGLSKTDQHKEAERARDLLRAAARQLWARYELQQLWGYVGHQRFLAAGERRDAEEAASHYRLALDLARESPRSRAAVLSNLAALQSAVGNFAIAVMDYEERDKLPFIAPLPELRHRLDKARALFHLDRRKEALRELDLARTLVETRPELAKFKPLVIDRAALYLLDAQKYEEARALYDVLAALLEKSDAHNQITFRMGRAAASLGARRPSDALADLDAAAALPDAGKPRIAVILAGLRAQAWAQKGDWTAAIESGRHRRELLAKRYEDAKVDEDALELAVSEAQLSEWSWLKKDFTGAKEHLEAAFARADTWSQSTGTEVFPVGLQLLDAAARLRFEGNVTLGRVDLAARLTAAQNQLCRQRNPDWVAMRERITAWLTRIELEAQ